MQIGILYNPSSGRGRAKRMAESVSREAATRGHSVRVIESQRKYENPAALLGGLDALVIAGGDGTVMALLDGLAETGTPLYMLPAGNESLISRAFGMVADPAQTLRRIESRQLTKHYFAYANNRPFFLMASIGLDSQVIAEIHRERSGPIGHQGYFFPTVKCLYQYAPPTLRISSDGKLLLDGATGHCIVANRKEYARGLDPVPEADSATGELVLRFFPEFHRRHYLSWVPSVIRGQPVRREGTAVFRADNFLIESADGRTFPVQTDGEYLAELPLAVRNSGRFIFVC